MKYDVIGLLVCLMLLFVRSHTQIYTDARTHICISIRVCVYMYVHTSVCVYMCVRAQTLTLMASKLAMISTIKRDKKSIASSYV